MEIPKKYDPKSAESKWYDYWLKHGFFHSEPDDREPYTVVIPPPNVTGVLHMGHMLNNTIQDVLVRKARMMDKNTCWVPGTDHASIATEAKVVQKLKQEGIKKSDLSRDEFMKHAWEWTEKHGGIILEQLKKLGASCDWDRTTFTMDEQYSKSVIDVFNRLYEDGSIYRGQRMINWDPQAKTALSNEEVVYKEVNSKLYHVKYKVAGTKDEYLTIATTRPETILGDTAICINPKDKRYEHLHDKRAIVPLIDREIPIILDEYVDMEFGTGCLKVTPAHDMNDNELGEKYDLETVDVFNADGTMSEAAQLYVGEDRFEVRTKLADDLKKAGLLEKTEDYQNKVGFSERTDVPIEPRISQQWFVSMEKLSKPALEHVMNDDIMFHPPKFKNSYRHWMENIRDWCISRQLWWGHRIPAWYYGEGDDEFVVAENEKQALDKAKEKSGNDKLKQSDLKQDEDVLDTWFSSWLWPISVFNGLYDEEEISYYYPTNDLVTAPEIMFFWVARMIMAGYKFREQKPFSNVYYTGIVRDSEGRKMSKSLGNSPDPLELIDKYGADGVRTGMLFSSPAGNDLLFDVALCEQGRNFCNKLWNAFRLIKGWEVEKKKQPMHPRPAINWMDTRLSEVTKEIQEHFARFRISDALMTVYKFTWDDFCSWFLEAVKPDYGDTIDHKTYARVVDYFESTLKLLHPFMPFITEEIWQLLEKREKPEDALVVAEWPRPAHVDQNLLDGFEVARQVVTQVRNVRKEYNIPMKDEVELIVKENSPQDRRFNEVIRKLANLSFLRFTDEHPEKCFSFLIGTNEYFIPYGDHVDERSEKNKLEQELTYLHGFLTSVEKKLQNERFVNNAPSKVVELERKKQSDTKSKIQAIEEKLRDFDK